MLIDFILDVEVVGVSLAELQGFIKAPSGAFAKVACAVTKLDSASGKIISPQESKRLKAVESTFQEAESIAKAIGNASKVVVTIGPGENGPTTEVTTSDA
ncbi:hypothetical protein HHK36_011057 [Tetracentron sinense]|uniref:Uncharacterized protein n=1 Tax=Tetracentron sinense TaxID=13715 RepID=A0A835DK41_TETSI|nr:hypothetical protein HHK36_011057 [Tetracentron sinense]